MGYQSVLEPVDSSFFWMPLIPTYGSLTLLFIFCQFAKRDNSWIDSYWGIVAIVPNITVWIMRYDNITLRMVFATVPIIIWGVRLSAYIFIRHKAEDWRYQVLREKWEAKGDLAYYFVIYFYVFVGQGNACISTQAAALFVNIYSQNSAGDNGLYWTDFVGLAVWIIGFYIEVDSDQTLKNHLANPAPGAGKFCRARMWKYSRHPNYFGEIVMWWGIWIIACGISMGWVTIFSPILMTLLIRFVTGVPLGNEVKYVDHPEWQQVCRETNVFFPWFSGMKDGQNVVAAAAVGEDNKFVAADDTPIPEKQEMA